MRLGCGVVAGTMGLVCAASVAQGRWGKDRARIKLVIESGTCCDVCLVVVLSQHA
jgi:hypothetical protein